MWLTTNRDVINFLKITATYYSKYYLQNYSIHSKRSADRCIQTKVFASNLLFHSCRVEIYLERCHLPYFLFETKFLWYIMKFLGFLSRKSHRLAIGNDSLKLFCSINCTLDDHINTATPYTYQNKFTEKMIHVPFLVWMMIIKNIKIFEYLQKWYKILSLTKEAWRT